MRLAMSDPTDIRTLDELAFATGYVIKPMVAPELHILNALEKYYGIPRDIRYLSFSRKLGQPATIGEESKTEPRPSPKKEIKETPPPRVEDLVELIEEELEEEIEEELLEEVVEEVEEEVEEEVVEPHEEPYLFSEACRSLETVEGRDEIAEIILRYSLQFLERVALFIVRKHMIEGWSGRGESLTQELIQRIKIPSAVPSIFKKVIDSKSHYLGDLPDQPVNEKFVSFIGGVNPRTVVLIPISLKGRPVCILYGDKLREGSLTRNRLGELLLLANKAAMSFEMLIRKFKKSSA